MLPLQRCRHRLRSIGVLLFAVWVGGFSVGPALAQESGAASEKGEEPEALVDLDESLYDPDNAEEIQEMCAGCHGEFGEGGGDGTYPRLAGLSAPYIAKQLQAFKSRERENIPMFPFATERELPDEDVRDISIFLSRVELLTNMPEVPEEMGAYERLMIAKRVFNVPGVEGDVGRGEVYYMKTCRRCHGAEGLGRRNTPPLAGQHTSYIRRQIELMQSGEREHRNAERYFGSLDSTAVANLLAYWSRVDD